MTEPVARPRLLVLASTYPRWPGDPEPGFVHELAKRLTSSFEVTVLGPGAPGVVAEEVMDGVRVRRYRYAPVAFETLVNDGGIVTNLRRHPWKWLLVPGFLIGLLWRTWRLVRAWRPDAIHAHWLMPQGLVAAMLGCVDRSTPPFLVTSHGADLYALRTRPLQVLKRFVICHAAAATVVSSAMREELACLGADSRKISVQPMGVDLGERFTPDASVERSHDEILFVGRLVEKKGLRHLINAMPMIVSERPTAYLSIAGFGPEEATLRAQVARLQLEGRVRFLGAVTQEMLPAFYRRAALFIAPFVEAGNGDQEGLGLVMLEAAGCGCPVLASDLPATREINIQRMVPGDCGDIARQVTAFLQLPQQMREAMAREQRSHVLGRFDWEGVSRGYAKLLADVSGRVWLPTDRNISR